MTELDFVKNGCPESPTTTVLFGEFAPQSMAAAVGNWLLNIQVPVLAGGSLLVGTQDEVLAGSWAGNDNETVGVFGRSDNCCAIVVVGAVGSSIVAD